jgi:hypothetical protein
MIGCLFPNLAIGLPFVPVRIILGRNGSARRPLSPVCDQIADIA